MAELPPTLAELTGIAELPTIGMAELPPTLGEPIGATDGREKLGDAAPPWEHAATTPAASSAAIAMILFMGSPCADSSTIPGPAPRGAEPGSA